VPIPPGGTEKSGQARWIDLYADSEWDDELMTSWIRQAAAIKGGII
jgi:hypothetical protein